MATNSENYWPETVKIIENYLAFYPTCPTEKTQKGEIMAVICINFFTGMIETEHSSFFETGPSNTRHQFGGHNYRGQPQQRGRGFRAGSKSSFSRKTENQ